MPTTGGINSLHPPADGVYSFHAELPHISAVHSTRDSVDHAFGACSVERSAQASSLAEEFVRKSDGLERTRALAKSYTDDAVAAVLQLHPSPARDALVHLARQISVRRT